LEESVHRTEETCSQLGIILQFIVAKSINEIYLFHDLCSLEEEVYAHVSYTTDYLDHALFKWYQQRGITVCRFVLVPKYFYLQVYNYLQPFMICVAPSTTVKLIDSVATCYNAKVKLWVENEKVKRPT